MRAPRSCESVLGFSRAIRARSRPVSASVYARRALFPAIGETASAAAVGFRCGERVLQPTRPPGGVRQAPIDESQPFDATICSALMPGTTEKAWVLITRPDSAWELGTAVNVNDAVFPTCAIGALPTIVSV